MWSTPEQLTSAPRRYLDWKAAGYPGADELVPAWVQLMETLPGLAPVWSCEGHLLGKLWQGMYFGWAVSFQGYQLLTGSFNRRLAELLQDDIPGYWWSNLFVWGAFPHSAINEYSPEREWSEFCLTTLHVAPMPPALGGKVQRAVGQALQELSWGRV